MGFGAVLGGIGSALTGRSSASRAARRQQSALEQAQDFIREGTTGARGELEEAFLAQQPFLQDAFSQALATERGGLQDILGTLRGQTGGAQDILRRGQRFGVDELRSALAGAEGRLDPFATGGQQALQQQLALTGASGPAAQQAALDAFAESPGQQLLRESGERSIARQAAATGGLGGGALLADLQEFGNRFQQADLQQRIQNLGGIAGRGQQAASQLAQAGLGTGAALSDLVSGTARLRSGLEAQLGQDLASALRRSTDVTGGLQLGQGQQLAQLRGQLGTNLANLLTGEAANLATLQQGIGQAGAGQALRSGAATSGLFGDLGGLGGFFSAGSFF